MVEEKAYLTVEEAAVYLNKKRATVYNYVKDLGIKTHKFKRDRRAYLALADVKRIKEVMEHPWMAGPGEGVDAA
jgi:excisionase family DNA binding protein